MNSRRHFIVGIALFCSLQACTERMICPAYQSAFIHDKAALDRHFSYFKEDSTPKMLSASKDKFLIIDPMSFRKKNRSLASVEMKTVYPYKEDSLQFEDDFSMAERDVYDSTAVIAIDSLNADTTYMISLKKEKFNIDQELYLWYMREHILYPDVRLQMEGSAEERAAASKAQRKTEKKGIFNKIKGLFSKKNKSDSTTFEGETTATQLDGSETPKKKSPFSFLKGGNKEKKEKTPKVKKEKTPKEKRKSEEVPISDPIPAPADDEDDGENDF